MTSTPRLALPYLASNQAQKHVTLNESLRRLDMLVQLSVISRALPAPPAGPAEGACWIVAGEAGGAWEGRGNEIACWQDGAWAFAVPGQGWLAFVADEALLLVWKDGAWTAAAPPPEALQALSLLGLGTEADAENPFAAKLNKALWTARYAGEGGNGDLRYTLNKEASGNVLSLLMQTGWEGRAEIGLAGSDDLSVRVSADGTSWKEALSIDRTSGAARFPQGIVHSLSGAPGTLYIPSPVREIWRLDADRVSTPRTYTISDATGTTLTLASADVAQIYTSGMRGHVALRVWNVSKSPAEAAWVDWNLSSTGMRVTDAAHIAGWAGGDTLRLGDPNPTGENTLEMVALDISGYLQSQLGGVFPQKGVMLGLYVSANGGSASLALSANGEIGTAFGGNALSDGARNQMAVPIPCTQASPVSGSNLLFLREALDGASGFSTAFVRVLGVYA